MSLSTRGRKWGMGRAAQVGRRGTHTVLQEGSRSDFSSAQRWLGDEVLGLTPHAHLQCSMDPEIWTLNPTPLDLYPQP